MKIINGVTEDAQFGSDLAEIANQLTVDETANQLVIAEIVNQLNLIENKTFNDFLQNTFDPWTFNAINGGTRNVATSEPKHPGVWNISSSASANSGGSFSINNTCMVLSGGEKTTIIFKTAPQILDVKRMTGFLSSNSATAPQYGAYCDITDGVIKGATVNNGPASYTATTYTLAANTWYRLVIEVNSDATQVTYTLYADDSDTILWQDTLSTSIPTGALGQADVCYMVSPSSATVIGYIDYMDIVLPRARRIKTADALSILDAMTDAGATWEVE
jgi:spore coat protein U-like protein